MPQTKTGVISVTPTITAGIYSAGDALGGLLTFSSSLYFRHETGVILTATLIDKAKQDSATDLVLFNQTFSATSDNDAFDPSDADLLNCLGVINIGASDYADFNDSSIATVRNIGLIVGTEGQTLSTDQTLYGQLVTRGTPTYTTTSDVVISIGTLQD